MSKLIKNILKIMIYEYKCKSCEHEWEQQQNTTEPIKNCPKCEKETVIRLISSTSFVLKGNGWYKTGGY